MKRLALGGTVLVTAATTAACYGTPPVTDGLLQVPPAAPGQLPAVLPPGAPTPGPTSPIAPNPAASPNTPPKA